MVTPAHDPGPCRRADSYRRSHTGPACSAFATNTHAARPNHARATDRLLRPQRPGQPCRPRNPGFPSESHSPRARPEHAETGRSAGPGGRSGAGPPADLGTGAPTLGHHPAEAAWLPLGRTGPRRRLIHLAEVEA
jgi:hypothetical protein